MLKDRNGVAVWNQMINDNPNVNQWLYVAVSDALNACQHNYSGFNDNPFDNVIVFTFGRGGLNKVDWFECQSINELNLEDGEIVVGWLDLVDWVTPGQCHEVREDWVYSAIEQLQTF